MTKEDAVCQLNQGIKWETQKDVILKTYFIEYLGSMNFYLPCDWGRKTYTFAV